jgi:linoleoyl-CoA desaturase
MPLEGSFAETLRERIKNYFKENKISVKANREMKIKMFTGLLWWSLSYLFIYLFSFDKLSFFVLYVFHGWGHIFFSFNVGHDALHNAISKKGRINTVMIF